MKKIGIAGITSLLLLGSVAPVSAMSPEAASTSFGQPMNAMSGIGEMSVPGGMGMDKPTSSTETPVDTKISRDRAIELAKQYVTIPDDYKLQGVSYQSNVYTLNNSRGSWSISYMKQDQKQYYGNINVSVDSDSGKLLNYYINVNDPEKKPTFPPKVNLTQAKELALAYIAKMNPEEKDQLKYDTDFEKSYRQPLVGVVEYPLRFVRVVNGIEFPQNFIAVSYDGEGQIRSYTLQWDQNLTFKAAEKTISAEQAAEQFKKTAEVRLQYVIPNTPNGTAAPAVSYQMEPFMLDAQSGEALLPTGLPRQAQSAPVPVSDKPLADASSEHLKLSKEQAVSRVAALLPLPADAKLEDASYRENTDQRTGVTSFQWDLRWSTAAGQQQDSPSVYATVDSSTGSILRFSKYDYRMAQSPNNANEGALSSDQLKDKAIEAVKKLLPAYAHQLYLQPQMGDIPAEKLSQMNTFHYFFRRSVNGIATEYDSVNINLDRKSGDIQEFNSNLMYALYPDQAPKVISIDEAKKVLFSQYTVEQQYMVVSKGNPGMPYYGSSLPMEKYNVLVASGEIKPDATLEKPETKLVYTLKPVFQFREAVYLDAVSGEWKNRETNQIVKPLIGEPADIKGHWAEEALRLMLDYQALDVVDGKVQPDGLITRGELVKMLLSAVNGGYYPLAAGAYAERSASFSDVAKDSKYFAYVENAIDLNLIDRSSGTFQPDAALNRSEVADLIVRALGYRKLSETEGLFAVKATDIQGLANEGSISIVSALDIMTLNNGAFSPNEQVTRAQAATTFYKFLKVRSQLQDSPVNRRW
jgi:hypothetical protein